MKQDTQLYYDQSTIDLANKIIRLSMRQNDMAAGARASAYACVLLCRLMVHQDSPDEPLPDKLSEDEEKLLNDIFDRAEDCVESHTKGERLKSLVRQLVQLVGNPPPRHHRRRRPNKQRPNQPQSKQPQHRRPQRR